MEKTVIVVPCYNEEKRISCAAFEGSAHLNAHSWLFVDDGSRDNTAAILADLCRRLGDAGDMIRLPANKGKGEAVRQGMLHAIRNGATITGFFDADLATPLEEMRRLVRVVQEGDNSVVMGSRIRLLGTRIRRTLVRHYLGRIFATGASLVLKTPVYDTFCGAKAIRCSPALEAALVEPFLSRWGFDIELIGRLLIGTPHVSPVPLEEFVEVSLRRWDDISGSRLVLSDFPHLARDLYLIWKDLRKRRAARQRSHL